MSAQRKGQPAHLSTGGTDCITEQYTFISPHLILSRAPTSEQLGGGGDCMSRMHTERRNRQAHICDKMMKELTNLYPRRNTSGSDVIFNQLIWSLCSQRWCQNSGDASVTLSKTTQTPHTSLFHFKWLLSRPSRPVHQ